MRRVGFLRTLAVAVAGAAVTLSEPLAVASDTQVDTALIVSVDVSNSVDEARYKLQMEGIAKALEDPSVIDAIVSGPNGGILFSMVTWADKPSIVLPWTKIGSKAEAAGVAAKVRSLPHQGGEFTCMTKMLRSANDKIVTQIPGRALRVVIDVSGDGPDNCNADEPIEAVRDELVASGVTVNGLPILVTGADASPQLPPAIEGQPNPLETYYREKVMGGPGSFVLPADGYNDFGRAIRQKFVVEISGLAAPDARPGRPSIGQRTISVDKGVKAGGVSLALEVDELR